MSKYNAQLYMQVENNSMTLVLNEINPNSTVLEFGSADGYMTQYMNETLGCKVFIVEIDEQSYRSSIQYAYDGYCGDIESGEWEEKCKDTLFDYILFADVFEHLHNPHSVLSKAILHLKHNGRLITSIPNTAHSSIIIDLINNKFNYQPTGLLDNTHIHLFTYTSILEMLTSCGLIPITERATYKFPEETEFFNSYQFLPPSVERFLVTKDYGTVYQFVFTCVKSDYYRENSPELTITRLIRDLKHTEKLKLYADYDGSLDEHNVIEKQCEFGLNKVEFSVGEFNAYRFRIDFAERPCIVRIDAIKVNDQYLECNNLNGNQTYSFGNLYFFAHNDPYVFIPNCSAGIDTVIIDFSLEPPVNQELFQILSKELITTIAERDSAIEECNNTIAEYAKAKVEHDNIVAKHDSVLSELDSALSSRDIAQAERDSAIATQDIAQAERDSAIAERDIAQAERGSAIAERDIARAERGSTIAERDIAQAERDSAIAERDIAQAERDSAIAERDIARAERDSAIAERDIAMRSMSYYLVTLFRKIVAYFKKER